ncbi:TerC/Alx family metal homeostasis membrane protein [Candidatus Saccharibacteria bacterium]|jgi:tellurite resistance protein TerC|nr:TerC/Alx family metal homeostasis membrane protein [Candidatus Saccharibacteria bacterium]MBP9131662.1 TerC/Alx family metal homeostasis membrane protein [Candidatus Saccharibacteria bacterium]
MIASFAIQQAEVSNVSPVWWVATLAWFVVLLFIDLRVQSKVRSSLRLAVIRSAVWISLGILLGVFIWIGLGATARDLYFSGYLIEKMLSVDNIFVWSIILAYLQIPKDLQSKVLSWGIIGAIFFRSVFVFAGIALISLFEPILLVLGVLLMYTAIKLFRDNGTASYDPGKSRISKFARAVLPLSDKLYGAKLITKLNGKTVVTRLSLAIIVLELTDVLFAIDSVPAVLAIVRDPYIVLASNIAAVLGLRALYFIFEELASQVRYLNKGLGIILFVVGFSLLLEPDKIFGFNWIALEFPPGFSLIFIAIVLTITIALSIIASKKDTSNASSK